MFGLSALSCTASPDQPRITSESPLVMSLVYSLPVKPRIWPESAASPTLSIASMNWSTDAFSGSWPSHAATTPTVSRISVSIVTLPLYAGSNRASTDLGSDLTLSLR
jgi:hypothetical protein